MEQSSNSTCDFLKRAIIHFKYKPEILQTDNGSAFTHIKKTDRNHPLDILCEKLDINHKRIRPRTSRHNGKVERSHRTTFSIEFAPIEMSTLSQTVISL